MSANAGSRYRGRIVVLVVATVLIGAGLVAGAVSTQDYTKGDADTSLRMDGGSYYIGQELFFYDKWVGKVNCPEKFHLKQMKDADEIPTVSESGEKGPKALTETVSPDSDCQVVFDTSNMAAGLYGVYREWPNPTPFPLQVPGGGVILKPAQKSPSDDGDDGDGGTSDGSGEQAESSEDSGDSESFVLPRNPSVESQLDNLETDPSQYADQIDWSKLAPASVDVDSGVGKPGRTMAIQIHLTNTQNDSAAYILRMTEQPFTVVDREDAGGTWKEDRWLFPSIEPGATVKPSLTVRLPNETIGGPSNYSVRADAETADHTVAYGTADVAVVSNASLCQAIAGPDGRIGDGEVVRAANAWNDGEPLPSVGFVVGDEQILAIIEAWRDGRDCGGFTMPEPVEIGQDSLEQPSATGDVMP